MVNLFLQHVKIPVGDVELKPSPSYSAISATCRGNRWTGNFEMYRTLGNIKQIQKPSSTLKAYSAVSIQ